MKNWNLGQSPILNSEYSDLVSFKAAEINSGGVMWGDAFYEPEVAIIYIYIYMCSALGNVWPPCGIAINQKTSSYVIFKHLSQSNTTKTTQDSRAPCIAFETTRQPRQDAEQSNLCWELSSKHNHTEKLIIYQRRISTIAI